LEEEKAFLQGGFSQVKHPVRTKKAFLHDFIFLYLFIRLYINEESLIDEQMHSDGWRLSLPGVCVSRRMEVNISEFSKRWKIEGKNINRVSKS